MSACKPSCTVFVYNAKDHTQFCSVCGRPVKKS